MEIKPIAYFRSPFPEKFGIPRQAGLAPALRGRIVFEPEYRSADALRGLDGFDYLWLIWEFSGNRPTSASSGGSTASLRSAPPLASQSEAPVPPLTVPRVAWVEPARLASPEFLTSGGRVLMVVGSGKDLREARDKALAAVRKIKCENLFFRTDIGHWVL